MSLHDPMMHPALIDPRQWGEINLYEEAFALDRSPLEGDEHQTPDLPYNLHHLKLDLRFDDEARRIGGTATYWLAPMNDSFDRLELDAAEMEFQAVALCPETPGGAPTPLTFETFPEKLSIQLDRAYARHEMLAVEIRYSCSPRKGIFFVAPDEAYPHKPRQIWSQGENEDAHWWFPCHDVTNQKMSTELLATVREEFTALSNGHLVAVRDNADRTKTFHWKLEEPHPAYLVSIVIGHYEVIRERLDDLPIDYYVYPHRVEEGRKLFGQTPRMIEFFQQRYGYDYPYPKYAQALVDDFLFGAMENTSATTMTDRCLLDSQAELDLNYDDIVAHELAHQWWGDLVTCKDWTQIWLNESFATYSEYLWREHWEGHDEARWSLYQDFLVYLREDLTSHRRPILCRQYRFSEELMDRHAYEKGACVLDMLRWVLGDEPFFRSLSHYLQKHAFGVAETHDFKVAIEEATGQNLHWFFEQWLWNAGYPELEVKYQWQRDARLLRLSVKQLQAEQEDGIVFRFPVEIEIVTPAPEGSSESVYRVVLEKQEQDFYFPCEAKPRMVLFDKGARLFKLMTFEKSAEELIYQLTRATEMMDRVRAARELAAFRGAEIVKELAAALRGTDFAGVKMAAAVSLGEIGGDQARQILSETSRAASDPRIRRACLWALGLDKDEQNIPLLKEAIEKEPSYFAAVAAVRALANIGAGPAYDMLAAALSRTSWQEVIAAAVFHGFAHAKEKRAVDLAMTHSRYGAPLPVRVAAIGCLGAVGKELQAEKGADKIVNHLLDLLKDPNLRARVTAVRALGKIGNRQALPALRELSRRECLDMLRAASRDAIRKLEDAPH